MMDLTTIGLLKSQNWKVLSDSTLCQMKKVELIDYIRCLEHNWACALERVNNQRKLLEKEFKNERLR